MPAPDPAILDDLIARLETATGADRELDAAITVAVNGGRSAQTFPGWYWTSSEAHRAAPTITRLIGAARDFAAEALPDFWISHGLCALSGHASTGPDYNGSQGATLRTEWPEADFHGGFHADLTPGANQARECHAILHVMLQALRARALRQETDHA